MSQILTDFILDIIVNALEFCGGAQSDPIFALRC